jgi:hypothetical protein
MRKLLLVLLCFLVIPALGQESSQTDVPTMPNLSGLTVAQAHALLYEHGLALDPVIISTNSGTGTLNTIIDQSLAAGETISEGDVISVSVLREYNLELIWHAADNGGDSFTIVNLTEGVLNLEQLGFETADGSRKADIRLWPNILRERQCIQLWPFEEINGIRLDECRFLQGGGILTVENEAEQFWRGTGSFYVFQEGLRRAECLIIHNRSETEWLPLNQLALNDGQALDDTHEWDIANFSDELPFLAPNQCARISDGSANRLANCVEIASRSVSGDAVFWRDGFTVHSLHLGDVSKECPAAVGDEASICLLMR